MKIRELIDIAGKDTDLEATVEKNDVGQTSAGATVGIEMALRGFDWEHGHLVLVPKVKLCTTDEERNSAMERRMLEMAERQTERTRLLSEVARIVHTIEGEENSVAKDRIMELLRKM